MRVGIIGSGNPAALPADTIVVDAMNYYSQRDGSFPEIDDGRMTSSELLAAHLPGTRVVKAFNTMYWKTLRDRGTHDAGDDRLALFIAGDDRDAKERVSRLIEEIGFAAVEAAAWPKAAPCSSRDPPSTTGS
jgi:predicted dinucleotide-binding enzyme